MDPAQLFMNVMGNVLAHLLDIFGDMFSLITAVFSMNFYNIGKSSGELLMIIVN